MHHLMIAIALLATVGLDLMFVSFSDAASAALTFAVLAYVIMLLLTGSPSSYVDEPQDYTTFLGPMAGRGWYGFLVRVLLAYATPGVLLLVIALIPAVGDPSKVGIVADTDWTMTFVSDSDPATVQFLLAEAVSDAPWHVFDEGDFTGFLFDATEIYASDDATGARSIFLRVPEE